MAGCDSCHVTRGGGSTVTQVLGRFTHRTRAAASGRLFHPRGGLTREAGLFAQPRGRFRLAAGVPAASLRAGVPCVLTYDLWPTD